MREATGELNIAVITVSMIALLAAFFYSAIWPSIRDNFRSQTKCSNAICEKEPNSDGMVNCNYEGTNISCVWKG